MEFEFVVFVSYFIVSLVFLFISIKSYVKKEIMYLIKKDNMTVIRDEFYKLQLIFYIVMVVLLILGCIITYNKNNLSFFVSYYLIVFWLTNFSLKTVAVKKNYIKIDCVK